MIKRCRCQGTIMFYLIVLILIANPLSTTAQVKIKMQKEGGVYTLPCIVNGLQLRFILDTGASDVSISLSEAAFMLKNGYLDTNDLKGSNSAQIANGTYVSNTTIILKEINIGGIILKNINASIIETANAPLLLGQSALQKLGPYQINGDELWILNGQNTYSKDNSMIDQQGIRQEAKAAYDKELYMLAITKYEQLAKAGCANENDTYYLATSYYYTAQYDKAISGFKQLETASQKWTNSELFNYYLWMSLSYGKNKDRFQDALFYLQKVEMVASTEEELYRTNDQYAGLYYYNKYFEQAEKYAKKAIDYYGKWKNVKVDYYNPAYECLSFLYNAVMVGDIESNAIKRDKGYKILNKYAKQGNKYSKEYLLMLGKYDARSGWDKFKDFAGWE